MKKTIGIHVEDSQDVAVTDNEISGFDVGIAAKGTKNLTTQRNKISSTGRWLQTWWGVIILGVAASIIAYFIIELF